MIECSLQEAINRCRAGGGTFHKRGLIPKKYVVVGSSITDVFTAEYFKLLPHDFETTWIYEPPKQSAFQEWEKTTGEVTTVMENRARKEGWNAAIDAVWDLLFDGPLTNYDKIKELKEND